MNAGVGNIPWSNAERSGEMTKFMALTRGEGSFFYTVSPDPVHNIATIHWPAPFTGSLGHQIIGIQALRAQGGWRAGDAQQGLQAWARSDDGPLHRLPALEQRLRRSSVAAALRAASAPSQQHQLRRCSSSRRRQCPATIGQPLEWAAPRIVFRPRTSSSNCLLFQLIFLKSLAHSPEGGGQTNLTILGGLKELCWV